MSILPFVKKDLTVFWKLSDDIRAEIANNNTTLENEEEASSKIDEECSALQKKYTESMDLMVPQISALGVRKQCLQITSPVSNQVRINTTEENFAALMTSQYNSDATNIFRQQLFSMYNDGVNDGILDPMDKTSLVSLLNEWQLFGKNDSNSLFESISLALNSGLINANSTTNNPYSSNGMYSADMLREAVADNITQQDIIEWNKVGVTLSQYSPQDPERIPYNFLFDRDNKFIGNNLERVKTAILLEPTNGGKYFGDYYAVKILEKVFSVKIITIHIEKISQNKNRLLVGTRVKFLENSGSTEELSGTVTYVSRENKYNIITDDRIMYSDISRRQISHIDDIFFNVECEDDLNTGFTHCIILTEIGSAEEMKYFQVAFNMQQKIGIFELQQVPAYIYYLIFNNCFIPNTANNWYSKDADFKKVLNGLESKFKDYRLKKSNRRRIVAERDARKRSDIFQQGGTQVLSVPNKNLYSSIGNRNSFYSYSNYGSSSQTGSKLSYYIVIDLDLYPGESIPLGEQAVMSCQNRYEKIRQSYAQLFGIQYYPNEFLRQGVVPLKKKKDPEIRSPYLNRYPLY